MSVVISFQDSKQSKMVLKYQRVEREQRKVYICTPQCQKVFSSEAELRAHGKELSTDVQAFREFHPRGIFRLKNRKHLECVPYAKRKSKK